MTYFEKLVTFRRLTSSVLFYRSRKNYYSRLISRLASFNVDNDFSYINLEHTHIPKSLHLHLVDVVEVESSRLEEPIFIRVYIGSNSDLIMNSLYYKVYV